MGDSGLRSTMIALALCNFMVSFMVSGVGAILPAMGNAGNTTERGMGYTDAYGRPLKDYGPEEVKPRKRPRGGAYGTYGRKQSRPLPDPDADTPGKPAWDFN